MTEQPDTIVANATPPGRGGIGIVRVSGPLVPQLAKQLLRRLPLPRRATFAHFVDNDGETIDLGIALYFPAPHSFTGEDVLELQGHGGPVLLDQLIYLLVYYGARLARPGEFSERAFLNGKIDLAQAEAIADLIDSTSIQAARCAIRSLQGEFSGYLHELVEQLIKLRSYIEAGIDFVEEEIDLLADGQVIAKISQLITAVDNILTKAFQGYLLKEGVRIALVGEPNVGKSSLLNSLSGRDTAIVTPIPGTTRDLVQEQIQLDGIPIHIVDTAGLRETTDIIEQEGIRRTQRALKEADLVILVLDDRYSDDRSYQFLLADISSVPLVVRNKIDLTGHHVGLQADGIVYLSAKTGDGIEDLKACLKQRIGFNSQTEGVFMARRRHLDALERTRHALQSSLVHAQSRNSELLAEELRQAQVALGEITGEVTADDLLDKIFSTFCIGK
ncbi:MAG: tRNA uridine-5-carboxymethylaminomethyl(34) synthesis GTPase MnmE [Beggiatoa sp. IS2]|nr:MAG: tRNA uridine-5-carboxymethylaminomethyl(34) synthesis GTPase MnmE [Beggiatoa sp. IS2]